MPKALIVDDEPEANRLLALLVELRGYATESAFGGGEALMQVERGVPDVLFLDLMLPDINGFDVCRALKRGRKTNPVPIIMVTARLAPEGRLASVRLGANQYVPKPYTPDQLFEALDAARSWRRSLDEHGPDGTIRLGVRDEIGSYGGISRFQGLLLARTTWGEEPINRLIQDLRTLAQNLIDWGRRQGVDDLADLAFDLRPDRITLVVRDLAGWGGSPDLAHDEALGLLLASGHFDAIDFDEAGGCATLVKNLADPASTPAT